MNLVERSTFPTSSLLACATITLGGIAYAIYMWETRLHGGLADALPVVCLTSLSSVFGQFVLMPMAVVALRHKEAGGSEEVAILAAAEMVYLAGMLAFYAAAVTLYYG